MILGAWVDIKVPNTLRQRRRVHFLDLRRWETASRRPTRDGGVSLAATWEVWALSRQSAHILRNNSLSKFPPIRKQNGVKRYSNLVRMRTRVPQLDANVRRQGGGGLPRASQDGRVGEPSGSALQHYRRSLGSDAHRALTISLARRYVTGGGRRPRRRCAEKSRTAKLRTAEI